MTIPRSRRPSAVLVALLVGLVLLTTPARAQETSRDPAAKAEAEGRVVHSWALTPGDGLTGERTNLSYELAPGGETQDVATLYNLSNVPLTFFVYSTDGFNTDDGTFDLLPFGKKPKDVGSWFDLPDGAAVTVAPHRQVTFPFTIKVPADARPGDHVGAMLASSAAVGSSPSGDTITVDRRTGPRVYVRVAGPLEPQLSVERLRSSYEPALNPLGGTAKVTYRIENRGNVRLGGKHRVSVGGPLGLLAKKSKAQEVEELLPGQGISVTTTLEGVPSTALAFAEVDLDVLPLDDADNEMDPVQASRFMLAVPASLLAVLIVLALALYARRSYLRHRTAATAADGAAWS